VRIEGYELLDRLGQGAQGSVHRVRDVATGAERAMKLLEGSPDAERIARFRREAEALARVGGAGIVPVHGSGVVDGRIYFIMDLVPGGSLEARLRQARPPWREAVQIAARIARTLERVAAAGLVHRDLKPANVLFGESGEPLLADFGCARDLDANTLTESGTLIGTPLYMPPEQLDGKRVDASADVFALGAILHEMLTGAAPFAGHTPIEIWKRMHTGTRPAARPVSGCPRSLDELLDRALALEPRSRPSAGELAAALEAIEDEESSRAPMVAAGALAVVAIAVGLVALGSRSESLHPPEPPAPPSRSTGSNATAARLLAATEAIRRQLARNDIASVASALRGVAVLASDCPADLRAKAVAAGASQLGASLAEREKRLGERVPDEVLDHQFELWTALRAADPRFVADEALVRRAVVIADLERATILDPDQARSLTRFFVAVVEMSASARCAIGEGLENRAWRSVAHRLVGLPVLEARVLSARLEAATGGPSAWSHYTAFELFVESANEKTTSPGPALAEIEKLLEALETHPVDDIAELLESELNKHGAWLAPVAARLEITRRLVAIFPSSRWSHFARARVLAEALEVAAAQEAFETARRLDDDVEHAERHTVLGHSILALAWERKGDPARARAILEGPPAPGPEDKDPIIRELLRLEIEAGDHDAALDTLRKNQGRPGLRAWLERAQVATRPDEWRTLASEMK
jgi:hypothetical protein